MLKLISAVLTSVLLLAGVISAQGPAGAGRGDNQAAGRGGRAGRGGAAPLVSPEVHADRTVTLRLNAPKATEVVVSGNITVDKPPTPMIKDDKGVWILRRPALRDRRPSPNFGSEHGRRRASQMLSASSFVTSDGFTVTMVGVDNGLPPMVALSVSVY